jgi:hypothetical protein
MSGRADRHRSRIWIAAVAWLTMAAGTAIWQGWRAALHGSLGSIAVLVGLQIARSRNARREGRRVNGSGTT